jgi:Glycogen recognition site of AMP-activated protein kinase
MGNQQSKPPSRSTTQHEKDDKQQRLDKEREREQELLREREGEREREKDLEREKEKKVYRRISFQGLPHGKATAADPSATTESTLAQNISQPPAQNQTLHQHLHAVHSHSPEQSGKSIAPAERSISPGVIHEGQEMLQYRSKERPMPLPIAEANAEPSIPMDVPGCTNARKARNSREGSVSTNPSPPPSTPQYTPISSLQRPPRLPLAIADEVRAPESPLLEATSTNDEEVSIFDDDEADLPRKNSALSSATAEDEDVGNELQPYAVDTGGVKVVPTRIDWKGSGERVYVTGTFAHWDKKFRLHQRCVLIAMCFRQRALAVQCIRKLAAPGMCIPFLFSIPPSRISSTRLDAACV